MSPEQVKFMLIACWGVGVFWLAATIWADISFRRGVARMAREFAREFPGRCLVCSFHRFGVEHGLTSGPVRAHSCSDRPTTSEDRDDG